MHVKMRKRSLAFLLALVLLLSTFVSVAVVPASAAEADVAEEAADIEAAETGLDYQAIEGFTAPAGITLFTDTTYPWAVYNNMSNVIVSTNVGADNTFSRLKLTVGTEGGLLSFQAMASSEDPDWDFFYYKKGVAEPTVSQFDGSRLGGTTYNDYSEADAAWTTITLQVDAGDVIGMAYRKDSSFAGGADRAWVRNISFTPASQLVQSSINFHVVGTGGHMSATSGGAELTTLSGFPGLSDTFYSVPDSGMNHAAIYSDSSCSPASLVGAYQSSYEFTYGDSDLDYYVKFTSSDPSGYPIDDLTFTNDAAGNGQAWTAGDATGTTVFTSGGKGINSANSQFKITAGKKGVLSFEYHCTSEGDSWDYLCFQKNDDNPSESNCIAKLGGSDNNWYTKKIELEQGDYVTFAYIKDDYGNGYDDCGKLRNISFNTNIAETKFSFASVTGGHVSTANSLDATKFVADTTEYTGAASTQLEGTTFYMIPDVENGYYFDGLYTTPDFQEGTELEPNSSTNPRAFTMVYPNEDTVYYPKFVQYAEKTTYKVTYAQGITGVTVRQIGASYTPQGGGGIPVAGEEISVADGGTFQFYPGDGYRFHYTVDSDYLVTAVDLDDQENYVYQNDLGLLVQSQTETPREFIFHTTSIACVPVAGYNGTEDNVSVYTRPNETKVDDTTIVNYSWTYENGIFSAGNHEIADSYSILKIVAEHDGMLCLDFRVSCENNWDYMVYRTDGTDPVMNNMDGCTRYSGNGANEVPWTTLKFPVHQGDDVRFNFYKDSSGDKGDDIAQVRNVRVVYGEKTISTTVNNASYGSVTETGLTEGKAQAGEDVTLTATPAEGASFIRWMKSTDNGATWVNDSSDAEYTFSVSDNAIFKACFAPPLGEGESAVIGIKGTPAVFGSINTAVEYANTGDVLVVLADYTQTTDVTIPAGITLLVPYDDNNTVVLNDPPRFNSGTADGSKVYTEHRCLTLGDNVDITVNGTISVAGDLYPGTGGSACSVHTYGRITMADSSTITVNIGAKLYAWGFITGGGNVYAESGSQIFELMQICDFRGGTNTTQMLDKTNQFPFNQYYIQNIESNLTIKYGAVENVFYDVHMTLIVRGMAEFIGPNGMFVMDEGSYIVKHYDPAKDKMIYDIYGDAAIGSMVVTISGNSIDTANYYLPINAIEFELHNGTLSTDQDVLFLPGSSVTVDEGSSIVVQDGGSVIFSGKDGLGKYSRAYCGSYPCIPTMYSPTRTGTRTWAATTDAEIDNNGSIVVEDGGAFGSTAADGANIYSSQGKGVFTIEGENEPANIDKWAGTNSSDNTRVDIMITTPVLTDNTQTADEHSTDVDNRWNPDQPTTFRQIGGVWGDYRYLYFYDMDADPDDDPPTDPLYVSTEMVSRDQLDDYLADHPEIVPPELSAEDTRYDFLGWEPDYDFTSTLDSDKVWLSANYQVSYQITWQQDDGEFIEYTWVVHNRFPEHEAPTKESDDTNSYTFDHWETTDGKPIGKATKPATYRAVYRSNMHSLTLNGTIGVNFYLLLPDGYDATNTYVDFEWGHAYVSENTYSDTDKHTYRDETGETDGSYVKFSVPIAIKELNDEITATVTSKSDDSVVMTDKFTGTKYAYKVLGMTDDEIAPLLTGKFAGKSAAQLRQLVKDMLIYSAKAQTTFAYEFSGLSDAKLDPYTLTPVDTSELRTNDMSALAMPLRYYGTSMNLGSGTSYDIVLWNPERYSITSSAVYSGTDTEISTTVRTVETAAAVRVDDLPAARITDDITLTINGNVVTVNTGAYIKNVLENKAPDDSLYIAVTAMYAYNQSAKELFN